MSNLDLPDFLKPELEKENFTDVDVLEKTDESTDDGSGTEFGTKVIVYNDNYHTFEQVVNQLMKAIKCSEQTGFYHALTIHEKGKSIVYSGEIQRCLDVAEILREINLKVQVVG